MQRRALVLGLFRLVALPVGLGLLATLVLLPPSRGGPGTVLAASAPAGTLSRLGPQPVPPAFDAAVPDPPATAYPPPSTYAYPHGVVTASEAAQLRAVARAYVEVRMAFYREAIATAQKEARLRAEEEARQRAAEAYARELAAAVPPAGVAFAPGERWVAIDLARQRAIAFEGGQPLHVALVTTGDDGWDTPRGDFRIYARIENETMDSLTIGIPREDDWGYYLENVYYTQYFVGAVALHYNYWRPDSYFGNVRSSHGCVGMRYDDALYFWQFASYGTRVVVF